VCELGFLGKLPVAPGTWGSLGATLLYAGLFELGVPVEALGVLTLVLIPAVIPICNWTSLYMAQKDPSNVVIDELVGQWLALFPVYWSSAWIGFRVEGLLAGFFLFRFFDVLNVFPLGRIERWSGGWGIVLDDCMAGLYASGFLMVVVQYLNG
jgi:phosphatidylglycerophosphatase A